MPPDSSPPISTCVPLSTMSTTYLKPTPCSISSRPWALRDAVEHAGGVEGAGDGAGPLLALEQPLQQHRETLVSVHQVAVFIHGADAVGVAIGGQAGGAVVGHHGLLQVAQVRQNRLRIDARKERIDFAVNFEVIDAELSERCPRGCRALRRT